MDDVIVVGGGIIGLSVARALAGRQAQVTVLDPAPGQGATRAAAGMIAPVSEAAYGEEPLLALHLASAAAWPAFAEGLERETGMALAYDASPTLSIALDAGDLALLEELHRFQAKLGLESRPLGASGCRGAEPLLSPQVRGGLEVPSDHKVDPRRAADALLASCRARGCRLLGHQVGELLVSGGRCTGVRTADGEVLRAGWTVLAAGWRSPLIAGLPPAAPLPVRPVKGQILRLRLPEGQPRPRRTVRAVVKGSFVYVVPRLDGEIVIGATMEEMGDDTAVTAGAVYRLLRDAQAVLPVLLEAELVETGAALRPGSPDNSPMVGETALPGLVAATGHFRHGILLTPVTAEIVESLIAPSPGASLRRFEVCDPRRFASGPPGGDGPSR